MVELVVTILFVRVTTDQCWKHMHVYGEMSYLSTLSRQGAYSEKHTYVRIVVIFWWNLY